MSLVNLPLSPFDIIILNKMEDRRDADTRAAGHARHSGKLKPSAVPEEVFRGTRDRPLPAWAQLAFLFRERRRHDKARPEAGAGGQRLCSGISDAQKAPGPRGAQIQPKSPCPPLLGLHAGHGDKAQRARVGV